MSRPKANPEQQRRSYELHLEGFGPTAILHSLEREFVDPVSPRTLATWVKAFKGLSEAITNLDAPFEWHRVTQYGLPWDASAYLLEMWVYIKENFEVSDGIPPMSVRQARWFWRVHQAVPEISQEDTFYLALRFVVREQLSDLLGQPAKMYDLEVHLAYQPWASEKKREVYLEAVKAGRIPAISSPESHGLAIPVDKKPLGESHLLTIMSLAGGTFSNVYPELLESQVMYIFEKLLERDTEAVEAEALKSALAMYEDQPPSHGEGRQERKDT